MKFLFIPGVNNTPSTWNPTRAALQERGYESVAVDCQAIGDIDELAKTLVPDGDEPFIVVGHSFGGMVALSVLDQMPDRVKGIVLVNSTAGKDTPEVAKTRLERAQQALDGGYQEIANGASARAYHPENAGREDLMAARRVEVEAYGAERFAAHQQAMAGRPDRSEVLKAFQNPKLVVAADQDVVITTAKQQQMAENVGAEYAEIAMTGHMLPAEAPEALAGILADWAKKHF